MIFLTNSYVRLLGLEVVPVTVPRNYGFVQRSENDCLPRPTASFREGVVFRGWLYLRDSPYSYRRECMVGGQL